jgi:hypothetical protein
VALCELLLNLSERGERVPPPSTELTKAQPIHALVYHWQEYLQSVIPVERFTALLFHRLVNGGLRKDESPSEYTQLVYMRLARSMGAWFSQRMLRVS